MNYTTKLLKRLPKKYHKHIEKLEAEDGLIDECKYIVYLRNTINDSEYSSYPVKSITEAIIFIKSVCE